MRAPRAFVALALATALSTLAGACTDATEDVDAPPTALVTGTTIQVSVQGRNIAVECLGAGTPTVWFVSDLATTGNEDWGSTEVPQQVSERTRVCTYDRPGLGASESASQERTVENQADELAELIEVSGEGTPVVVVADGYGSFIARLLAQRSLPLVSGLVLVDPTLWYMDDTVPEGASAGVVAEYAAVSKVNEDLGGYGGAALPPPPAPTVILGASHDLPKVPGGEAADTAGTTPGSAPGTTGPSAAEREERQRGLANKSPFGQFLLVDQAGSWIQHWEPEAVVAAIVSVLDSPDLKT